jgi:hypothetical protein
MGHVSFADAPWPDLPLKERLGVIITIQLAGPVAEHIHRPRRDLLRSNDFVAARRLLADCGLEPDADRIMKKLKGVAVRALIRSWPEVEALAHILRRRSVLAGPIVQQVLSDGRPVSRQLELPF